MSKIATIARKHFGWDQLRDGQEESIQAILDGHDTLVVQPTGSGKSAIYQIAGMMLKGPTIIVSPLIALQRDQLQSIQNSDADEAAVINSQQRVGELRETFEKIEDGDVEYIFLSPEQLQKEDTFAKLKGSKPSLFVIDEAHCISEWGHDFRPDYLRLGPVIEELKHPRVLAMTATASPLIRDEIINRLGMKKPKVFVRGFDRPNIALEVRTFGSEGEKREALLTEAEASDKPGIIYVATRKNAEEIGQALQDRGIKVVYYHGGMRAKERDQVQSDFMSGDADVIVATNAFGMGVDKADVRFVLHADISDSLDSYYQEVGRAGRDGKPSKAILFYRPENVSVQKFLKGGGKVNPKEIQQVAELVHAQDEPIDIDDLKDKVALSERKLVKAVARLEEVGAVERLPSGEVAASDGAGDLAKAAEEAAAEQERRREFDRLRIEKMQAYAELHSCRREYLLTYFGEEAGTSCGNCDNCLSDKPKPAPAPVKEAKQLQEKARVVHKEWGRGLVESAEGDKITILFDEVGRKTLSMSAVSDRGLLERVA